MTLLSGVMQAGTGTAQCGQGEKGEVPEKGLALLLLAPSAVSVHAEGPVSCAWPELRLRTLPRVQTAYSPIGAPLDARDPALGGSICTLAGSTPGGTPDFMARRSVGWVGRWRGWMSFPKGLSRTVHRRPDHNITAPRSQKTQES